MFFYFRRCTKNTIIVNGLLSTYYIYTFISLIPGALGDTRTALWADTVQYIILFD